MGKWGFVGEYGVICRHDTVRFLLPQEWSTWGRGIVGGMATVRTRHCEIPAFAGMVYLGTGNCGGFGEIMQDSPKNIKKSGGEI